MIQTVKTGVNIALDVILIPTYGAFGAVMGSGFANLFVNATTRVLVGRYSRVPLQLTSWSKIAASALLMSWVVAMLFVPEEPVSLLGRLCVFTIGIIVLAAILKPFSAEDVRLLSEVSPQLAGRVRFLAVR